MHRVASRRWGWWLALLLMIRGAAAYSVEGNLLANGGFEHVGRLTPRHLEWLKKNGVTFEDADPLLPMRWSFNGRQADLRLTEEARSGARALRVACPKGEVTVELGVVEVVPGASYSFGAWLHGDGRARLTLWGNAYEGRKELGRLEGLLTNAWSEMRGTATIPGNIRTVTIALTLWGCSAALADDVFLSADLAQPFAADAVLHEKPQTDEHTLVFVDFDGQGTCNLEAGAVVTEEGRFGKGARLEKALCSTVTIPLSLPKMPEQGTLEFWLAPDDEPAHIYWFMALIAGDVDVLRLQADTSDALTLTWRISSATYGPQHSIRAASSLSRGWFRKGQWTHVAIQWDPEAVRYFLNGVLVGYATDRPLPFFKTPSAIKLGSLPSVYAWSGMVDEIRLSDIQRYGPVVPVGARWTPLVPPAAAVAAADNQLAPASAPPDFAKERTALIEALPAVPPDAVALDALLMKPLVDDDPNFKLLTNTPVPGMNTALIGNPQLHIGEPDLDGGYWTVQGVQPGRYYVGVWYESGKAGAEANQHYRGALFLYVNGRIVQFATTSDPRQVAPGVYYAEAQARDAVLLRPGDEVAVLGPRNVPRRVARLTLYPREPTRGRNWMPELYHAGWFNRRTTLGLGIESTFLAAAGKGIRDHWFRLEQEAVSPDDLRRTADGTQAVVQCRIANPLPVPLTVEFAAEVRGYFRELVGQERTALTLRPHQGLRLEIPFRMLPDARRYTLLATAGATRPPRLDWPEAEEIVFFPGLRQLLPWPDPFTARDELAIRFTGALPEDRVRFALNGTWDSAFTTALTPPVPPPTGLEWKPRYVPFPGYSCVLDRMDPVPHGLYLRRGFTVPETDAPKTWRLIIEEVASEGTVYVNGHKVGRVRGGNTPLVCDVTEALRPGTNEILLLVRDAIALMNPAYVNSNAPAFSPLYLDAPGGGNSLSVGEISMEAAPRLAVGDVLVTPSVRKRELATRFTVTSHEATPRRVAVAAQVLDAGTPVLEVGRTELTVKPGETKWLSFSRPWKDPVFWGPSNPKLYTLAVTVTDPVSGEPVDRLRERFGFRESWVQDGRIYFNGAPVRLKGSTCQGGGGVPRDDIQWSRGTQIPDFMDEFGYLVSQALAAIFNSSSQHNVDRDVFWQTATSNVLAGAALQGNHPCIIAWDLSNEWLSFLDYGGGDPLAGARRFKTLADVLREYDPSRWIFFNGDEDAHGLHDTFSTHYMLEAANGPPIGGFGFRGHSNYFPDGAFFRRLDEEFRPGQEIVVNRHRNVRWRYGEKPLLNTENLWKVSAYQPPGPSKFVGEDDVLSPAIDSGRGPIAWMWKLNVDGHRDLGCSAVCNYSTHPGISRGGHMLQCFIMPDHTHHYFSGATLRRDYALLNDQFLPAAFVFRWELRDTHGKVVRRGKDARRMASGDLQRGSFALALPKVTTRTLFALRLTLEADGQFAYGEERDIEVWPDVPVTVGPLARKVLLYEPIVGPPTVGGPQSEDGLARAQALPDSAGTTPSVAAHVPMRRERQPSEGKRRMGTSAAKGAAGAVLRQAGVDFRLIEQLQLPVDEASKTVLIIAEGAVPPTLPPADVSALHSFVSAGGRVLVLAQTNLLPGLPVRTTFENREWSSMPFVRTPQHPVFAGQTRADAPRLAISSWDLHFWSPDHLSAQGAYAKPEGGPSVALVDSGTDTGLEWVQMLECYQGRGLYLLCQLPLVGKYDVEPMARELLARVVEYVAGAQPFREPVRSLEVVVGPNAVVVDRLRELGVALRVMTPESPLEADSVRLVDAATLPAGFQVPLTWKAGLEAGATLIVHGPSPEHAELVSTLAGKAVRLTVQPYGMWEGRGYRNGYTWLTPGMSHLDLYWKEYDGAEAASAQAEDPKYKLEDLCWWSAQAEGMTEHIFPGALIELPVGRGRLIVDTLRWETTKTPVAGRAARVVSAFMTGLGVALEPYVPPRPLPAGVAYRPLDLTAFANRGFADEVGEDGKGGWSDQGPKIDLRDFPTGRQVFGGVPFSIGAPPHSCIVLKSDARPFPELVPDEVIIPVEGPVEGLWFLHGLTYGGKGEVGLYQIQYADGSAHDIRLVAEENIRDWIAPPGPLPKERGTQSRVAWTGTTQVFPVTCIYQMLWVNPKPDVPVRAVRFANPTRNGCPILIALTAAVKGEAAAADTAERDRARALLKEGQEAFAAGRDAEAKKLFEAAIKADPTLDGAYQALGQVCERLKDEEGALAAYRAWTQAGARTPLPYNRLGEILERRGDHAGALEAYTRSLEIEWNQPPVIEAKRRLSDRLRK